MKVLGKADLTHRMPALLAIIGTFPGLYQMLPSPLVDLGDDHGHLFEPETWGEVPARPPLLMRAQALIRDLHEVIDAERLLYVAGYNQRTPARIRIDQPGRFSYLETDDGDGRVPHALGLLDGVTTYWISEIHGDLPKNRRVLDAITELLQHGSTLRLPTAKPSDAAGDRRAARGWVSSEDIAPVDPAIDAILSRAHARNAVDKRELTPEEAIRLGDLAFAEYLGTGGGAGEVEPYPPGPTRPLARPRSR